MIEIDGSKGEGGGQIIRTSLALSIITGTPFSIERVRAGRSKPGLQKQHLTSVKAAQQVGAADVEGAELNASRFSFTPNGCHAGNYHFSIGTAGSTTLVLQTVLPPLMLAGEQSTLILEGGTHNEHAPPYDFIHNTFLPVLAKMGPHVDINVERYGFYPPGGGRLKAVITPVEQVGPLEILERGSVDTRARVLVVKLPRHIAERELEVVKRELGGLQNRKLSIEESTNAVSPGNVVFIECESDHVLETITSIGKKGVPAETVAHEAAAEARRYQKAKVPVGEHLADQLIIPMALAGSGSFLTSTPSLHTTTNIDVVKMFLSVEVKVEQLGPDQYKITFNK